MKTLACELPAQRERSLSRYSTSDLVRYIAPPPAAPATSASALWRILEQDALKPWRHLSGVARRDPAFAAKAGRVLDLYAGVWDGQPLASGDHVLSADEKTSIQARVRCAPTAPPRPGAPVQVEHEYDSRARLLAPALCE